MILTASSEEFGISSESTAVSDIFETGDGLTESGGNAVVDHHLVEEVERKEKEKRGGEERKGNRRDGRRGEQEGGGRGDG